MKTEFHVHFTRQYTRAKLQGLTPKSSLAFPTLENAKRWIKNVQSNGKLDYVLRDARITERRVESDLFVFSYSPWECGFTTPAKVSQCEQKRDVLPARKVTDFTEDKHQARWFRRE